jgi:uncharacterized membrane protein YsdA (DUF1294 family)/cold shock CspA family protein
MRYQGKVSSWKDDQGYGFVTQNGGGERAFVHIRAFSSRARRPVDGDLITYEVQKDARNRLTATNIRFVGERAPASGSDDAFSIGSKFAIVFSLFLVAIVLLGRLPSWIILLYLGSSVITFIAYALDKSATKQNRWRTKESTLHLFGLVGGWPGALLAQRTLRHKSKKDEFQSVFWTTVGINCLALGWLMTEGGLAFLKSF